MKKYLKYVILGILALAVGGIAYFDTYPTYFAKNVTLSEPECQQLATLIAAHAYSIQMPGEAQPKAAQDILDKASRLSKRVAKYFIEKYPDEIAGMPPMFIWMQMYQSCVYNEGKATLE